MRTPPALGGGGLSCREPGMLPSLPLAMLIIAGLSAGRLHRRP
jgi:hypothetical protein